MEDKKYKIADLQEKSEEWKIPFSNLLAGFVLEEFMLRFSASEFKNRFLLRNGTVLGLEQYRKKNILKLDFFCEPDEGAQSGRIIRAIRKRKSCCSCTCKRKNKVP